MRFAGRASAWAWVSGRGHGHGHRHGQGRARARAHGAKALLRVATDVLRAVRRIHQADESQAAPFIEQQTMLFAQHQLADEKLRAALAAVAGSPDQVKERRAALCKKWLALFPRSSMCEQIACALAHLDCLERAREGPGFRFRIAWVTLIMHAAREMLMDPDASGMVNKLCRGLLPTSLYCQLLQLPELEDGIEDDDSFDGPKGFVQLLMDQLGITDKVDPAQRMTTPDFGSVALFCIKRPQSGAHEERIYLAKIEVRCRSVMKRYGESRAASSTVDSPEPTASPLTSTHLPSCACLCAVCVTPAAGSSAMRHCQVRERIRKL